MFNYFRKIEKHCKPKLGLSNGQKLHAEAKAVSGDGQGKEARRMFAYYVILCAMVSMESTRCLPRGDCVKACTLTRRTSDGRDSQESLGR